MKAAVYHQRGAPEVLRYEDVPDPVAAPGVLVSVEGGNLLHRASGTDAGGGPRHRLPVLRRSDRRRERGGPASIVTTADTYTSVLPETAHRAAQATADMIIKAARGAPGTGRGGTAVTHVPAAVTASGYCQM